MGAFGPGGGIASQPTSVHDGPFPVEYWYKVRWGQFLRNGSSQT